MTKAPIKAFLMGMISGALLATLAVMHLVNNDIAARNAFDNASKATTEKQNEQTVAMMQRIADTWRGRAETCEAKFNVVTVIYQPQPVASVPLLGGMTSLEIGPNNAFKPSIVVPAQVEVYTSRPDVRFEWLDGKTGASKDGVHVAGFPAGAR